MLYFETIESKLLVHSKRHVRPQQALTNNFHGVSLCYPLKLSRHLVSRGPAKMRDFLSNLPHEMAGEHRVGSSR
jgi:hypothetical protein